MASKVLVIAGVGVVILAAGGGFCYYRSRSQKNLQKEVGRSLPKHIEKLIDEAIMSVNANNIQLTRIDSDKFDPSKYEEISIKPKEANEWASFLSSIGSEAIKAGTTGEAFQGLVKCDVPLTDLIRVKGNPSAMRGLVFNDGSISKHASFSEAGLSNMAPLLVYQCMAAVTSQYYQQIITERLDAIESKLKAIQDFLESEDRARLRVAYNRFVEINKKSQYDIADKQNVSESSRHVEIIREKYRDLLNSIKVEDLRISFKWCDKKEAEKKIEALENSRYFDMLEMAMQAEMLYFIASALSTKVALSMGNEEDAKIYSDRLVLNFWDEYAEQFHRIKHDVITYLELEAESAIIKSDSIYEMVNEQKRVFDEVEKSMKMIQSTLDCHTSLYIKVEADGSMKQYISLNR